MTNKRILLTALTLGFLLPFGGPVTARAGDPLPSWNDAKAEVVSLHDTK